MHFDGARFAMMLPSTLRLNGRWFSPGFNLITTKAHIQLITDCICSLFFFLFCYSRHRLSCGFSGGMEKLARVYLRNANKFIICVGFRWAVIMKIHTSNCLAGGRRRKSKASSPLTHTNSSRVRWKISIKFHPYYSPVHPRARAQCALVSCTGHITIALFRVRSSPKRHDQTASTFRIIICCCCCCSRMSTCDPSNKVNFYVGAQSKKTHSAYAHTYKCLKNQERRLLLVVCVCGWRR